MSMGMVKESSRVLYKEAQAQGQNPIYFSLFYIFFDRKGFPKISMQFLAGDPHWQALCGPTRFHFLDK